MTEQKRKSLWAGAPTWAEVILAAVLTIAVAYGWVSAKQAQAIIDAADPAPVGSVTSGH